MSGLLTPETIINEGFLAPRGVCLIENYLIVADTAQNKIFIFSRTNNQFELKTILGNQNNQRSNCTAAALHYPSGIWSNGEKLIVADAWNHRVLIWNQFPTQNYQQADVVIGQKDFTSNQPNIEGLTKNPTAKTLYWCYGIWSNGSELWIADTGNRRVLYFEKIPTENYATADALIGQNSFEEKDYEPQNAIWPYAVKISEHGEILIADTQYNRCMYWKEWKTALKNPCDFIIGQPDIESSGQNQFMLKANASSINWCYDAVFNQGKIIVADTANSRILFFNSLQKNNQAATHLIGQEHFNTNGEASLSLKISTDISNNLYWPFSISIHQNTLAVADTGKSRIVIYNLSQLE